MSLITCPGCGLTHTDRGLPVVPNRAATGECVAEAGAVQAAFYAPDLLGYRQYVVDAYACLHADPSTRIGVQATALCLMTMDLYLECGQPVSEGSILHQEMIRTRPDIFTPLPAPDLDGVLTQRHLLAAPHSQYAALAAEWARSVWDAWSDHHAQVRAWNQLLVPHRVTGRPAWLDPAQGNR
ncbi:DUF5946 family protein [Micromonospora sp. CB01531]|uniref:DUF5946 family protein n=1 Tax=Micromonospora sp. CB01531 TaxID=1718947 RepID=UPI00093A8726|nr:DUF5946 family protein [Micromonospora sp. CB01531]OKI85091.1 hypothetical protein A6A27_14905 [Micromonospora sp. CB01531]